MNSKNRIKLIRSLKQKKYRQKYNKFVCEGAKLAREVLIHHRDRVSEAYGTTAFIESLEPSLAAQIVEVSKKELEQMSSLESNQDALLVCKLPHAPSIDSIKRISFYLDGVRDPGNMGTIMRICDWFGWRELLLSPDCVDVYNPKVVQASMGSVLRVKASIVERSQIAELFAGKPNLLVADMQGEDYRSVDLEYPVLIVLGNESNGPSSEIMNQPHRVISIPKGQGAAAESLNVAIAAGILAAEYSRTK